MYVYISIYIYVCVCVHVYISLCMYLSVLRVFIDIFLCIIHLSMYA